MSSADRKGNAKHEHAIRDTKREKNDTWSMLIEVVHRIFMDEMVDFHLHAVGSDTEEHERVVALEVGQVAGQTGCDF